MERGRHGHDKVRDFREAAAKFGFPDADAGRLAGENPKMSKATIL